MRAGVTIREIQHHLAARLGTELSHETISNITEAVMDEVTQVAGPAFGGVLPGDLSGRCGGEGPGPRTGWSTATPTSRSESIPTAVKHVLGIWVQAAERGEVWGQRVHPNWPTAASRTC